MSESFTPPAAGNYSVIATYNGGSDPNYTSVSGLCTDPAEQVAVAEATPAIATVVSDATLTVGDSFTDTATLTYPSTGPAPTGTVTFNVYGPNDPTCAGTPVLVSSSRPLTGRSLGRGRRCLSPLRRRRRATTR